MKKASTLLFTLLLLFLFVIAGKAENRSNFTIDEETSIQIKLMVCTAYGNEMEAHVIHGKLISAFEWCRKQGWGIDECVEKIKKIQEDWRKRCSKDSAYNISHSYKRAVEIVKKIEAQLKDTVGQDVELMKPIERLAYFQSLNKNFAQLFPGSEFSFQSGTGKVVLAGGETYFQNWRWIQTNIWSEGGILIQAFPKRITWVMDRYNISIFLDPETLHWELIDFNLPFDMQSEKILLTLGQGVRVTEREIIRLADIFLHDTTWGLELNWFFPTLLLNREVREDFLKAMVEYFTFDNYIAKVRAEGKRKEGGQGGQGGEQGGKTRKKK
jgi:hypothetical protein